MYGQWQPKIWCVELGFFTFHFFSNCPNPSSLTFYYRSFPICSTFLSLPPFLPLLPSFWYSLYRETWPLGFKSVEINVFEVERSRTQMQAFSVTINNLFWVLFWRYNRLTDSCKGLGRRHCEYHCENENQLICYFRWYTLGGKADRNCKTRLHVFLSPQNEIEPEEIRKTNVVSIPFSWFEQNHLGGKRK